MQDCKINLKKSRKFEEFVQNLNYIAVLKPSKYVEYQYKKIKLWEKKLISMNAQMNSIKYNEIKKKMTILLLLFVLKKESILQMIISFFK